MASSLPRLGPVARLLGSLSLALGLVPASVARAAPPASEIAAPEGELPLVLLMADEDELGLSLRRAVGTELNDVDLRLEPVAMVAPLELRDRIAAVEALLAERGAAAVVWVEARAEGLEIYLVVADNGMLRRSLRADGAPQGAVEAAAVVVRHFITDLLAGRLVGLTQLERDDGPAKAGAADGDEPKASEARVEGPRRREPVEAEPDEARAPKLFAGRGRLRLQVAYLGQVWSDARPWDSALELSLGWRLRVGAHFGLGYVVTPRLNGLANVPAEVDGPQLIDWQVRRYPLAVVAGYQHLWSKPRLALDAQLRVHAEFVERRLRDPSNDSELDPDARPLRVTPVLEPRLQLDWLPIPPLSLFVAAGLRIATIDYAYLVEFPVANRDTRVRVEYLDARRVSPMVLAGIGVYL